MAKLRLLVSGSLLAALMAFPAAAQSSDSGPNSNWQFRSYEERITAQNSVTLMQQKQNDYYKIFKNGSAGAFGSGLGAGLLSSGSSTTGNLVSVVSQTENNCTAASGAVVSCGSGSVSNGATDQANSDSPMSATTTTTGNTVTNEGNQTSLTGTQNGGSSTPFGVK